MRGSNDDIAVQMDELLARLFPICRSITGNGVRKTLAILKEYIPLEAHEVASGTRAFDWTVPKEWNIRDAYIKGPGGRKFAEFATNNLHVMNYSIPIRAKMSLSELRPHLHSLPNQKDLIPYKTSYYEPGWGFCITHRELESLEEGEYEVCIDSTLDDGSLTYGELYLKGAIKDEVLLSCYVCHPSMANDNTSGIALLTFLAQHLAKTNHRYSYRFLFVPETIGALVWLSKNKKKVSHIRHGLVVTCVGDNGPFTYKKSRNGNAEIDRIVTKILADSDVLHEVIDFFPYGSDERQYCSPGFNLPVGSLMRTMYYRFPQYHTSGDDLNLVKGEYLADTLDVYKKVIGALEYSITYKRTNPYGEPQLGKRGLYANTGGQRPSEASRQAIAWVLNFSDGFHSLLDIALRSKLAFADIKQAADILLKHELIKSV
ncbi:DUF4910 domain-containing protein [Candidatus Kaiserbacteria bacterium]|nr:DUF4910 domain-containing protein [Candidatus Kaiserbacteria bacterium]